MRLIVTASGWYQLPGIPDMAKLQFGQSFCQIEGAYVPVADMGLAAGDGVYFAHHVLLWKDLAVEIGTLPLRDGWSRLIGGLPLVMAQAQGPGHIAFSRDEPGELIALPIQPGQAVDVREHVFMVATNQVAYDWFGAGIWFTAGSATHYPLGRYMDRFCAPDQPGLVLLHGAGNVFVRRLADRETILVKPTALLFKDTTVGMQLHVEHPGGTWKAWRAGGERFIWLRLQGPGRVAVQSAFPPLEDCGEELVDSSRLTRRRW